MNRRALLTQAGLTGGGVMLAYLVGSRADGNPAGDVIVLQATRADVEKIRYEDGSAFVELTPGRGPGGFLINAVISARHNQPVAPTLPPASVPERRVRGSQHTEELFRACAPMRAERNLGVLPPDALDRLGFSGSTRRLLITVRGLVHAFTVAVPPSGAAAPYLRSQEDGRVYVVGRGFLNTFLPIATADHRRHLFSAGDYDRLVIMAGGQRRVLSAAREAIDQVMLFEPGDLEHRLSEEENWHREVWNAEPTEVLGQGERPAEGEPRIVMRVEYLTSRGELVGFIDLGTAGSHQGQPWAFARTEHAASWLRMPSGFAVTLQEGERFARGSGAR